ncbi:UDP-N-acetylmuramoyl-tripeptide--D-alanyl-D-alanine ligase [bacterium]|nr:UDP-N-acetylmuramoyl-tripeptide--D-alanyl-D-alanine ligase [bacterium]
MKLTPETVIRLTGGEWLKMPDADICQTSIRQISIDSRKLCPGDLFWALKGEIFDGHDFVAEALDKGALAAVVSRHVNFGITQGRLICVEDTLEGLQMLAASWRDQHPCPIVAVTGSCGKTTTKELIAGILSQKFKCLSTEGNMNNHIGVPLTLLRLRDYHEAGVLELGMNHQGEIAKLTAMIKPKIGAITNIGKAHIGFLGSINGIVEAKAELLDGMGPDGLAVLNRDDPFYNILAARSKNGIISLGESEDADIRIDKIEIFPQEGRTDVSFKAGGEVFSFSMPVLGRFIAYNLAMAVAIAIQLGCGRSEIEAGIRGFIPSPGRMHHHVVNDIHILDDSYNANPESVHLALKTLIECKGTGRSLAILGDMLELGDQSECLHRQLGQWLGYKRKVDFLIAFGPQAKMMAQEAIKSGFPAQKVWSMDDHEAVVGLADSLLHPKDWALIKGSRQMSLDKVSKRLIDLIGSRNSVKNNVKNGVKNDVKNGVKRDMHVQREVP